MNSNVTVSKIYLLAKAENIFSNNIQACIYIDFLLIFSGDSEEGCLVGGYCPAPCKCAGTVVRCSRSSLTTVPTNIPSETTELYAEYYY